MTQQSPFDRLLLGAAPHLVKRHRARVDIVRKAKVTRRDDSVIEQHNRTPHAIPQFANIAGPVVRTQCPNRVVGKAAYPAARIHTQLVKQMPRQKLDVRTPCAQRRLFDLEHTQPMIEILAKPSFARRALQIDVSRTNDSHVSANRREIRLDLDGCSRKRAA